MELRVLRYFLAVAREGSVTGAANFLHVTQPTLSRQIKDLEEELGTKLFVRHSHSVSLTPDGMRLRKRAEEVVDMIEKTEAEFAVKEESVEGDVHIGAGETRVMRHVAEVIHELRKDYPNIHIHLYSGNLEDVTERLDKGLLDFGVLIEPVNLEGYDYLRLPATDTWGLLLRRDHPLARLPAIRPKDLEGVPLLTSRQRMVDNEFAGWLGREGHSLDTVGTYNLLYNASLMVTAGVGCALALDGLIHTQGTPLTFRPLEPRVETHLNLVWKKYHPLSQAAERFLAQFQETLQEI